MTQPANRMDLKRESAIALPKASTLRMSDTDRVHFRPVQYLGNKQRSLDHIREALDELLPKPGRVTDLFTGTSVVAQSLAGLGHIVTAVDVQRYACVMATALLGVGRATTQKLCCEDIIQQARQRQERSSGEWMRWQRKEAVALHAGDADALRSVYEKIPLGWRTPTSEAYSLLASPDGGSAFGVAPLLTTIYSGTYFGVEQALQLDAIREVIEERRISAMDTEWQQAAALTALMSAASAAVHSAGKHFAQPLTDGLLRRSDFHNRRLLSDRNVDVFGIFGSAGAAINSASARASNQHVAVQATAEDFLTRPGANQNVYYLDPPYTAQQYSRFYHVLDVICDYRFPQLIVGGEVTRGLYPSVRFKSAFSSKRRAPLAFQFMLEKIASNGADAVISYSNSAANSRGNARMVTLDQLIKVCVESYGTQGVQVSKTIFKYRQFNSSSLSNDDRDDPEVLIVCKKR